MKKGPKPWPSGSAKSRLYMKPRSSGGLASAAPPAAAALSQMASTSARLSTDKAIRSCAPARGSAIGLGVSVEKNALSDTMKEIVSGHFSAEACPLLKLGSFTKPNASQKAVDLATSATGRPTKIARAIVSLLAGVVLQAGAFSPCLGAIAATAAASSMNIGSILADHPKPGR